MDSEQLRLLIQTHGLAAFEAAILARSRPAIYLHLGTAGAGKLGQSRLGGTPDLPPSIAWPQNPRLNKYRCFLLQINLAELPTFAGSPLPQRGLLSTAQPAAPSEPPHWTERPDTAPGERHPAGPRDRTRHAGERRVVRL